MHVFAYGMKYVEQVNNSIKPEKASKGNSFSSSHLSLAKNSITLPLLFKRVIAWILLLNIVIAAVLR